MSVTDEQIKRWVPLIHGVLNRMDRRMQLVHVLEREDLVAVGMWAVWDALQKWETDEAPPAAYIGAYIWRYLMHYQRDATKALGWHRHTKQRIADVDSYERPYAESMTLLETLAGPHDTFEHAYWTARLTDAERITQSLREPYRTLAGAILDDQSVIGLAQRLGFAEERAARRLVERLRSILAGNEEIPSDWKHPAWQLVGMRLAA